MKENNKLLLENKKLYGAIVKHLREADGTSLRYIAEVANMSASTLSRLEQGDIYLAQDKYKNLEDSMGVSIDCSNEIELKNKYYEFILNWGNCDKEKITALVENLMDDEVHLIESFGIVWYMFCKLAYYLTIKNDDSPTIKETFAILQSFEKVFTAEQEGLYHLYMIKHKKNDDNLIYEVRTHYDKYHAFMINSTNDSLLLSYIAYELLIFATDFRRFEDVKKYYEISSLHLTSNYLYQRKIYLDIYYAYYLIVAGKYDKAILTHDRIIKHLSEENDDYLLSILFANKTKCLIMNEKYEMASSTIREFRDRNLKFMDMDYYETFVEYIHGSEEQSYQLADKYLKNKDLDEDVVNALYMIKACYKEDFEDALYHCENAISYLERERNINTVFLIMKMMITILEKKNKLEMGNRILLKYYKLNESLYSC